MNMKTVFGILLMGTMLLPASVLYAADKDQDKMQQMDRSQTQSQDKMIYGWQLMSVEERAQHRAKMQSFNTEEERAAYRKEHHKKMQARAEAQGVDLPDEPIKDRGGPGPGARSGGGGGGGGAGKGK
ncbi:MAG: hypothetical protein PVF34_03960 [Gammaproteobacteria bacterium]